MDKNFDSGIYRLVGFISVLFLCVFAGFGYALFSAADAFNVSRNQWLLGAALLLAALVAVIFGTRWYVERLLAPLQRLRLTSQKVMAGDLEARCGIRSGGEFQQIGDAIDNVLSERVSALSQMEGENELLNDSVVKILETVAILAQKDLSVRAKVNEDVTGPLADALNLLASETSKVLGEVTMISGDVAETSNLVKAQSDNVLLLANEEQTEVEMAAGELRVSADTMTQIAKMAEDSNQAAENAIETTATAMNSVNDTVNSINVIRDSIREAEKRIKRLGERSQEISAAVNMINNISERTHILALNASMHAASAGETGRGFAVVADEVQRLAENAKDATSQIGTLVDNIQVETSNTVSTMNELIAQVISGSRLAEAAGVQMEKTQLTTTELVNLVKTIAENASKQAKASTRLRDRADVIHDRVRRTGKHLEEQTVHTDELVEQAMALVASVGVFKLQDRALE